MSESWIKLNRSLAKRIEFRFSMAVPYDFCPWQGIPLPRHSRQYISDFNNVSMAVPYASRPWYGSPCLGATNPMNCPAHATLFLIYSLELSLGRFRFLPEAVA